MNIKMSEIDYADALRKSGETGGLPIEVFNLLCGDIEEGHDEVIDEIDCPPAELLERIRSNGEWKTLDKIAEDYDGDAEDLELNPHEIAHELYPYDHAVELDDFRGLHGVLMWSDGCNC